MGGNNGGFVLDISEAGLSFQGIMPLSGGGQTVHVKFKLPGANTTIQAEGQLVHPGNSEMGGGLRLVNLTDEERLQLRAWVTRQENAETPAPGQAAPVNVEDARAEIYETKQLVDVAAESVAAKPELSKATPPAAPAPPAPTTSAASPAGVASVESQTKQSAPASPRPPAVISELKVSARPRAGNGSLRAARQPVLQSNTVKAQRPAKSSQTTQFVAGLVAGCLTLMAIGGGLVATGRLRLNWSSSEPGSASEQANTNDARSSNLAPSSEQTTADTPAADIPRSVAGMVPPTLMSHSDPEYPQEAKAANVQGSVDVLATIGTDGVPRALRATSGDTRLAAAAVAAISQWRYKPATLNGQPAEARISITVTFAP